MKVVVDSWVSDWSCPECGEYTQSCDEGVEDENDYFEVKCQECEHEYEVYKE